MLAIEVDGISHADKNDYDLFREKRLKMLGITILKFDGMTVIKNTDGVLRTITDWIDAYEETHP
jgi:very-short-patch-repair endonuclease